MQCHSGYECMDLGQNLGRGFLSFDDIGSSMLSVFVIMVLSLLAFLVQKVLTKVQILTLRAASQTYEGAYDIIYPVQDSSGSYTWIFFQEQYF